GPTGAAGPGMAFTSSMGTGTATTILGGLVGTAAAMPISGAELTGVSGVSLAGGTISVSGNLGLNINLLSQVQKFPRTGTLSSLQATFANTAAISLGGTTVTPTATLWKGSLSGGDIVLSPTTLTCAGTPGFKAVVTVGTILTCSLTGQSLTVNAGDYGLIVISETASGGINLVNTTVLGATVAISE
ncbi:hypothetical protein, partial [Rudaea sp.]|uniref:hypothetical protein n=1 Tax=Rudaea sp. TaxID=2136325 RepID=UPI002ED5BC32